MTNFCKFADFKKNDEVILHYFFKWDTEIFIQNNCVKDWVKSIATFDYVDKSLLVLSAASSSVSFPLSAVIVTPVRITSISLSLLFFVKNGTKKTN